MLDDSREAFREEVCELLSELEASLLELEENPRDTELIGQVFRAMHTIKGAGAMFGFDGISAFTHDIETVYDLLRNGRLELSKNMVDLSLAARDRILGVIQEGEDLSTEDPEVRNLIAAFRQFLPDGENSAPEKSDLPPEDAPAGSETKTFRIRFRPNREIFLSGTNPIGLLNELRELGVARAVAHREDLPSLDQLNPEHCYVFWNIILTTDRGEDAIRDVFIFVEDESEIHIDVIEDGDLEEENESYKKLGEILVERGDVSHEALEEVLRKQKRLGEMLVEANLVSADRIESALEEQKMLKEKRSSRSPDATSIRVQAERLDKLVDLVGELVTVQSRLSQTARSQHDNNLLSIAEEVERLTEELRDSTLDLRMLPIGTLFGKFIRLVRDLSGELGKEIDLVTQGGETELDKTVIERLGDPLVHILRNSMDHGIEPPEERQAAGKSRLGTVRLSAEHSGDSVVITIADDGRGLDTKRIRGRAIEKGVISESDDLSPSEIQKLIFAPGFSTAESVSSVSGRGVGMDVVKKAIESLRGVIDLSSDPGQGTTIRIRLPLTLAIIDSLLVKIGRDHFLMPLSLVEECVELTHRTENARESHLIPVRGHMIPYLPLRRMFDIEGRAPGVEQVVITRVNGHPVGLVVDHIVGEHQTVIKSLGRMYRDISGVSGATILGDGSVALILDVPQLVQMSEAEERRAVGA